VILRGNLVNFLLELDFRKFLDNCLILIVIFRFSLHFKPVQFTVAQKLFIVLLLLGYERIKK